jgi:hypothetical protein
MKNIYKNALSLVFNKEIELNVKGSSRVSKLGLNINVPFNYTGKHQLNIF